MKLYTPVGIAVFLSLIFVIAAVSLDDCRGHKVFHMFYLKSTKSTFKLACSSSRKRYNLVMKITPLINILCARGATSDQLQSKVLVHKRSPLVISHASEMQP